ncbi:MAG: hypothetical protein US69_C0017G0003 [candidate division TM6 bacterium GW2011_GWF2_38_10]|nr:MAG: hypothetical protein US69_C0017G0003 [candidate division TM6 bacterium GW2011_GWF2_38_10]
MKKKIIIFLLIAPYFSLFCLPQPKSTSHLGFRKKITKPTVQNHCKNQPPSKKQQPPMVKLLKQTKSPQNEIIPLEPELLLPVSLQESYQKAPESLVDYTTTVHNKTIEYQEYLEEQEICNHNIFMDTFFKNDRSYHKKILTDVQIKEYLYYQQEYVILDSLKNQCSFIQKSSSGLLSDQAEIFQNKTSTASGYIKPLLLFHNLEISKKEYPYLFAHLTQNNISYASFFECVFSPIIAYLQTLNNKISLKKNALFLNFEKYNKACYEICQKDPLFFFWQISTKSTTQKIVYNMLATINKILETNAVKNQIPITYTSFLDDGLLQTYVTLKALSFLQYNNITLNIIANPNNTLNTHFDEKVEKIYHAIQDINPMLTSFSYHVIKISKKDKLYQELGKNQGQHVLVFTNLRHSQTKPQVIIDQEVPTDLTRMNGVELKIPFTSFCTPEKKVSLVYSPFSQPIVNISPLEIKTYNRGSDGVLALHHHTNILNYVVSNINAPSLCDLEYLITHEPNKVINLHNRPFAVSECNNVMIEKFIYQDLFFELFIKIKNNNPNSFCCLLEQNASISYSKEENLLTQSLHTDNDIKINPYKTIERHSIITNQN